MAKVLCFVGVLAVLIVTLWPFNPFPQNGVSWLQGTHGLKFKKASLVMSHGPLRPPETDAESYSLEFLLRPANTERSYTILGFYDPDRSRQLLVRQWTDGLLVTHDATIDSDKTRTIKFDVDHVFIPGRLVQVTISWGPNGTTVYVDGQIAESVSQFRISRSELSGEIVLGTSPVMFHPWIGELHGLAIYSRELTPADALRHYKDWTDPSGNPDLDGAMARYTFAERAEKEVRNEVASGPSLEIPTRFSVPYKGMLLSPQSEFRADWTYISDVVANIAGFVPLGVIVCAYLAWTRSRWKAILVTTAACGILSSVIEVLQYYVPRRASGTTDIITNTLGAAVGAMLTHSSLVRRGLELMKLFRNI